MKKFNKGDVVLCKNVIGANYILCKVIDENYSDRAIEVQVLKNNAYTVVSLIYCKKVTQNTIKKEIQRELIENGVTKEDLDNNVFEDFISLELLCAIKAFALNFVKLTISDLKAIKSCNEYDDVEDFKQTIIFSFFDYLLDSENITITQFKNTIVKNLTV